MGVFHVRIIEFKIYMESNIFIHVHNICILHTENIINTHTYIYVYIDIYIYTYTDKFLNCLDNETVKVILLYTG